MVSFQRYSYTHKYSRGQVRVLMNTYPCAELRLVLHVRLSEDVDMAGGWATHPQYRKVLLRSFRKPWISRSNKACQYRKRLHRTMNSVKKLQRVFSWTQQNRFDYTDFTGYSIICLVLSRTVFCLIKVTRGNLEYSLEFFAGNYAV